MRVGAIDCGTNSIRLLVADVDTSPAGSGPTRLVDLDRRMEVVRLGEGIDASRRITDAALQRTFTAARTYAQVCEEYDVQRVRFVATSASRDATNADEFVAGIREVFAPRDVAPEVVTGAQEASLSFRGATSGLAAAAPGTHGGGPYLVVDLGGGSTEFVRGTTDVEAARSVDIGCVRLSERHLGSELATPAQLAAANADVEEAVAAAARDVPFEGISTLVGLAGTITTLTAHALGLPTYDRSAIHLAEIPAADMLAACDDLIAMPRARRATLGYMHPGRVDVIDAGALVWSHIVRAVVAASPQVRLVTSEHDILDGIALDLATRTA